MTKFHTVFKLSKNSSQVRPLNLQSLKDQAGHTLRPPSPWYPGIYTPGCEAQLSLTRGFLSAVFWSTGL